MVCRPLTVSFTTSITNHTIVNYKEQHDDFKLICAYFVFSPHTKIMSQTKQSLVIWDRFDLLWKGKHKCAKEKLLFLSLVLEASLVPGIIWPKGKLYKRHKCFLNSSMILILSSSETISSRLFKVTG